MIKGVLLDLNGVIVDTEIINKLTWEKVYKYFNHNFSEQLYYNYIDGKKTTYILSSIVKNTEEDIKDAIILRDKIWFEISKAKGVKAFDDAYKFLMELKRNNVKSCVITSSRKSKYILEEAGISHLIDVTVGGEDILYGKPHPEIVYKALSTLKMDVSEVILFDDSVAGVLAGQNAKVESFFVNRNFRDKGDFQSISSFHDFNLNKYINSKKQGII